MAAPYTVVESDTVNCALVSGDASFGATPGSCADQNSNVATCAYVGGLYSASGSECTYVTEACESVCAAVVPDRTGANCLAAGTHCVWTAPIGSCMDSDGESVQAATQAQCEATTRNVWTEIQAETCLPSDPNDDTACGNVMAAPDSRDTACAAVLGGGRCAHVPKACVATHTNTCAQFTFAFERDVCESRQSARCTGTADDATVSQLSFVCLLSLFTHDQLTFVWTLRFRQTYPSCAQAFATQGADEPSDCPSGCTYTNGYCSYTPPAQESCAAIDTDDCAQTTDPAACNNHATADCTFRSGKCVATDAAICEAVPQDGSNGYGDDSVLRAQTLGEFLSASTLRNDAILKLGRADLQPGQSYSFTVNVTNMLGLTSVTTVVVEKTAASIPNVRAKSSLITASAGEDIILSTFATLPLSKEGCQIPKHWTLIDYRWTAAARPPRTATCDTVAAEQIDALCALTSPSQITYCDSPCVAAIRHQLQGCITTTPPSLRDQYTEQMSSCPLTVVAAPQRPITMDPITQNQKDLFIKRDTLSAYMSYRFELAAWLTFVPDQIARIPVRVDIAAESLQASIAGGNRVVGFNKINVLDGTVSRDPSGVRGTTYYSWACFMPEYPPNAIEHEQGRTSGPCLSYDLEPLRLPSQGKIEFPADSLLMIPGDQDGLEHVITLTVQKTSFIGGVADFRNATAQISLFVVPGDPPQVFIDALKLPKANPSQRLKIQATVKSSTASGLVDLTEWSIPNAGRMLDLNDPAATSTGRNSANLVINAGYLTAGAQYMFRLTATDKIGKAFAEIFVVVNEAPASGGFAVEPLVGNAVQTDFVLYTHSPSMNPWADDIEDMPLRYRFAFEKSGKEITLGQLQPSPNRTVQLPIGNLGEQSVAEYASGRGLCIKQCCAGMGSADCTASAPVDVAYANAGLGLSYVGRACAAVGRKFILCDGTCVPQPECDSCPVGLQCCSSQCNAQEMMKLHVYPTDKYGASAKATFVVTVLPPNITSNPADFVKDFLNSSVQLAIDRGDLDTVSQQSGALIDVLNADNARAASRRLLGEVDADEETANRTAARDNLLDVVVNVADKSARTGVFAEANLATGAALTSNACELSPSAIEKGTGFVGGILGDAGSISASTGSDAGNSISSLLVSSTPSSQEAKCAAPSNATSRRRALQQVDNSCPNGCGASSDYGECVEGECLCNPVGGYGCIEGRCFITNFTAPPGACTTVEDHCVNGTCFNTTCEPGLCGPAHDNCAESICVPGRDGALECYPSWIGRCTVDYVGHYVGSGCNDTQEAQAAAELHARRAKKCLSEQLHGAVGDVSGGVLSDRVVGEADVEMNTEAIKMASTRLAADGEGGGLGPPTSSRRALSSSDYGECTEPRFVLPPSIFERASESDKKNGVGAQVTGWDVNPFEFDGGSKDLDSSVASLTLSLDSDNLVEPIIVMLPRSKASTVALPAPCSSDSDCTFPSGTCKDNPQGGVLCVGPEDPCSAIGMVSDVVSCGGNATGSCLPLSNATGTMPNVTGTCKCEPGYEGPNCDEKVQCQYWSFEQERWSTDGCQVVNVTGSCTICHCSHLTDFASSAAEFVPPMNLVNPFEVDLLGAFMADPRNLITLALLLSLYIGWAYFCIVGHRRDVEERHQHYMTVVAQKVQRLGGIRWLGPVTDAQSAGASKGSEASAEQNEGNDLNAKQLEDEDEARPAEMLEDPEWKPPKFGAVRLVVERARQLKDVSSLGRMDPFAELVYGSHSNAEVRKTTRVRKHGGTNPKWRDQFTIPIGKAPPVLEVNVYDRRGSGEDSFVGRAYVDLVPALKCEGERHGEWYQLHEKHGSAKFYGEIFLKLKYEAHAANAGYRKRIVQCCQYLWNLGPKMLDALKDNHPWFSCLLVDPDDTFTRPQRITVLMTVIFGNLCIAAILNDVPPCMPQDAGYPDCVAYQKEQAAAERRSQGLPEETGDEATNWKQLFGTIMIISVCMLPCDRIFVSMFEKMEGFKQSDHARGPGERVWDLPEVPSSDTRVIAGAQALIRGFLARKRHEREQRARKMIKTVAWSADASLRPGGIGLLGPPGPGDTTRIRHRLFPRHPAADADDPSAVQAEHTDDMMVGDKEKTLALTSRLFGRLSSAESIAVEVTGPHTPFGKALRQLDRPKAASSFPVPPTTQRALFTGDAGGSDRSDELAFAGLAPPPPGATPSAPDAPPPRGGSFFRRRAFPVGGPSGNNPRPPVLTHYDPKLRYILTDLETALLIRVQACGRGLALRARLRRGWLAEWEAITHEKVARLRRKLYMVSLVVGTIQMKRKRYIRRQKRLAKRLKKQQEAQEEEQAELPPWYGYVAWTSAITWCILCGLYTLVLGIVWGPVTTLDWLFSSFGAIGYGGVIQDNFKIFMMVLLSDQAEMLVDIYYEFMDFMPFQ